MYTETTYMRFYALAGIVSDLILTPDASRLVSESVQTCDHKRMYTLTSLPPKVTLNDIKLFRETINQKMGKP